MAPEFEIEGVEELAGYLTSLGRPASLEFDKRVQRAIVLKEASRLAARMEAFKKGELDWLSLREALEVMALARSAASMRSCDCMILCDRLWDADEGDATAVIETLRGWVHTSPLSMEASIILLADTEMEAIKSAEALQLGMTARLRGWRVAVGAAKDDTHLLHVEMCSAAGDVVTLATTESSEALLSTVRFSSGPSTGREEGVDWAAVAERWRELGVPEQAGQAVNLTSAPAKPGATMSVADLFGEQIMLRDFEPRSPILEGIENFRDELGWDESFVPRKNESQYAEALMRIMGGPDRRGPERIVYVGDTLLNDGSAIRGLQAVGPPGSVWGFLCGAVKVPLEHDFALDGIYFAREWGSLSSFLDFALADGLALDDQTWVLFDLDQTVYAAKGRDDEALLRARWDGIQGYLESIVPAYKFDAQRAEALYREFDRDEYHPVTRDNLDYVVLLVLAVAAGLADAGEIRDFANSSKPSIGALSEELRRRAAMRLGHEDIDAVLNAVKAVSYNTAAGDQTPCKDFRRFECLAMAERMRGDVTGSVEERILLNRDVVDLIGQLRETPVRLFAVSDRPLEAAVVEADPGESRTDLMTVPMAISGDGVNPASEAG